MNSFFDLCLKRYSCRAYRADAPVSDNDVDAVIDAGRVAPSARNGQPWKFVVVRDPEKRRLILAKSRPAFVQAPVLIVACAVHDQSWTRPADGKNHADIDVAIAAQQMALQAYDLGLATCWVCSFDVHATRRVLDIPEGAEPVVLLPLGYAADTAADSPNHNNRKPFDEVCSREKF